MEYTTLEYRDKLYDDLTVRTRDMVILMCAIMIASIGLNLNSTPVIIGAMLISPLMTPILGLGLGLSIYDLKLMKKAIILLLLELGISLFVFFVYFSLSPISYASSEILARTAPTIWDIMIAIAGGTAGVIGSRQKVANNIVPGVAIATALMPPLCTVGFGIANGNTTFTLGAAQLFLINTLFIMLATYIGSQFLMKRTRPVKFSSIDLKIKIVIIGLVLIVTIPSLFSAVTLAKDYIRKGSIESFVRTELADRVVVQQTYKKQKQELVLTLTGQRMSDEEIQALLNKQADYGLGDITITINQVSNHARLSEQELFEYIDKYVEQKLKDDSARLTTLKRKNK